MVKDDMRPTQKEIDFWNRKAGKYAASPVKDAAAYERTLQAILSKVSAESEVYELGCGTGSTANRLSPHVRRVVATDLSQEMIAIARGKAAAAGITNVDFAADGHDVTGPAEAFDVALCFNTLHLIRSRTAAIAKMHRLLRPGGCFISKTPCLKGTSSLMRMVIPLMTALGQAPNVFFFSEDELKGEIEAAGFQIERIERHGSDQPDVRPFIVARKIAAASGATGR